MTLSDYVDYVSLFWTKATATFIVVTLTLQILVPLGVGVKNNLPPHLPSKSAKRKC